MSKTRKKAILISTAAVVLILIITFLVWFLATKNRNAVIVTVNGVPLRERQVDNVLKQSKELDRAEVIKNSINDLLIIQYGKENGCVASYEEISERMLEYKEVYPLFYDRALKIYGEEELAKGLENQILIEKSKEHYLNSVVNSEKFKIVNFEKYLAKYNLNVSQLDDDQIALAREKYEEYKEKLILESWVENMIQKAEIVYFK